jgi:D-aminopeptidase
MPTLADLRVRFATTPRSPATPAGADEVLVADSRSKMSPAQMVEQKLRQALCASRLVGGALAGNRRKRTSQ